MVTSNCRFHYSSLQAMEMQVIHNILIRWSREHKHPGFLAEVQPNWQAELELKGAFIKV
jgi:hypothetical protein